MRRARRRLEYPPSLSHPPPKCKSGGALTHLRHRQTRLPGRPRHEIKHDGFRIMALRDLTGVRLITRNGNDFTKRFPLAVARPLVIPRRDDTQDALGAQTRAKK